METPLMGGQGRQCRWVMQKSRFPTSIWLHCVLSTLQTATCYQHSGARLWQVVTLITGSKWWSLLMVGDDDKMFMTRSLNLTPKTMEQRLIVRSDKSVVNVNVTNNRRLHSTIEANYWQTRSLARPLCDSRATCTNFTNHSNFLIKMKSSWTTLFHDI